MRAQLARPAKESIENCLSSFIVYLWIVAGKTEKDPDACIRVFFVSAFR